MKEKARRQLADERTRPIVELLIFPMHRGWEEEEKPRKRMTRQGRRSASSSDSPRSQEEQQKSGSFAFDDHRLTGSLHGFGKPPALAPGSSDATLNSSTKSFRGPDGQLSCPSPRSLGRISTPPTALSSQASTLMQSVHIGVPGPVDRRSPCRSIVWTRPGGNASLPEWIVAHVRAATRIASRTLSASHAQSAA